MCQRIEDRHEENSKDGGLKHEIPWTQVWCANEELKEERCWLDDLSCRDRVH